MCFVGIICGLVTAAIYNRFKDTKLPTAFAFFSGKRLVPILSAATMVGYLSSVNVYMATSI